MLLLNTAQRRLRDYSVDPGWNEKTFSLYDLAVTRCVVVDARA